MLALIAGTGDLPPALVARLDTPPLVCALQGFAPVLKPDITFRLEHFGSFLDDLIARGVTEVCLAGAVRRPKLDPAAVDAQTRPLMAKVVAAMGQGDDGALRALMSIIEDAGLHIRAAHEVAPDLLPSTGVLTGALPRTAAADAALGDQTLCDMGAADLGQACVIRDAQVLVREGDAGTDAMLHGLQPSQGAIDARGAILFKAPKPDQDRRADLPVIGPDTARNVVAAGMAGIVIEAGGVMVLDQAKVLATLSEAGCFLWVRPKGAA